MGKNRLEAFSDGVLAIIITIMVLELKVPMGTGMQDLKPLLPVFLNYLLSYIYLAIYWNNHHQLIQAVNKVTGKIMWSNLHLLFWLSLLPFATGWMGINHLAVVPSAFYGFILLMAAVSYHILQQVILSSEDCRKYLKTAIGKDLKGNGSMILYFGAALLALKLPWAAQILYVLVAFVWLIPDRRIERAKAQTEEPEKVQPTEI